MGRRRTSSSSRSRSRSASRDRHRKRDSKQDSRSKRKRSRSRNKGKKHDSHSSKHKKDNRRRRSRSRRRSTSHSSDDRHKSRSRRSSVSKRSSKTESRTTSPKISASEKLKQDVISILKKKEPKEDSDVEEVKPSVAALDNINSDTFKQRQFKSTANKQSKSYNSTSNIASRGLSALNPTLAALNSNRYRKQKDLQELSIFNDKFFMDEDEKIANWMKKLTEYRSAFVKLRKPVVDA